MNGCLKINIKYYARKIHARHYKTRKRIFVSKEKSNLYQVQSDMVIKFQLQSDMVIKFQLQLSINSVKRNKSQDDKGGGW